MLAQPRYYFSPVDTVNLYCHQKREIRCNVSILCSIAYYSILVFDSYLIVDKIYV